MHLSRFDGQWTRCSTARAAGTGDRHRALPRARFNGTALALAKNLGTMDEDSEKFAAGPPASSTQRRSLRNERRPVVVAARGERTTLRMTIRALHHPETTFRRYRRHRRRRCHHHRRRRPPPPLSQPPLLSPPTPASRTTTSIASASRILVIPVATGWEILPYYHWLASSWTINNRINSNVGCMHGLLKDRIAVPCSKTLLQSCKRRCLNFACTTSVTPRGSWCYPSRVA